MWVKRKKMPNRECKRVFSPKLKPTVCRQIPATAPPCHTPPVTKRKGWTQSEIPAKKLKAERVCQIITCFADNKMLLLSYVNIF